MAGPDKFPGGCLQEPVPVLFLQLLAPDSQLGLLQSRMEEDLHGFQFASSRLWPELKLQRDLTQRR